MILSNIGKCKRNYFHKKISIETNRMFKLAETLENFILNTIVKRVVKTKKKTNHFILGKPTTIQRK